MLTGARRALAVADARAALPGAADLGEQWRIDTDRVVTSYGGATPGTTS